MTYGSKAAYLAELKDQEIAKSGPAFAAVGALSAGAGLGGAVLGERHVKKSMPKGFYHPAFGQGRFLQRHNSTHIFVDFKGTKRLIREDEGHFRNNAPGVKKRPIIKAYEPIKTSVSEPDRKRLIREHGLTGPLPKNLDRNQRMAAYEARYTTAGGHKAQKWNKRAQRADKVRQVGLGAATAAGAVWTASRFKSTKGLVKPLVHSRITHGAETAVGAAATAGGVGELYAGHARRKRSSYASAPAGVASSALRRMQAYQS